MVPTPLSTLVHIPSKQSRQCMMSCLGSSGVWEIVRRSWFGSCRRTADDLCLDLDISCVLVIDDRRMDLNCCFLRYGSFLEWFECHEWVYFSLFCDGFVQGHWRCRLFLFSGTC